MSRCDLLSLESWAFTVAMKYIENKIENLVPSNLDLYSNYLYITVTNAYQKIPIWIEYTEWMASNNHVPLIPLQGFVLTLG